MFGIIAYPFLGLFLLFAALLALVRADLAGLRVVAALVLLAMLCMLAAWSSYRTALDATHWRAVPPFTSVSSAFELIENLDGSWDSPRWSVALRNRQFTEAFAAYNHDQSELLSR
jgi:hypothetical protein